MSQYPARTTLSREELRDLSARLEAITGHDSIETIESKYLRNREPDGAFLCAYSERATMGRHRCRMSRTDPAAMWLHVHFTGHGLSWQGCPSPEAAAAALEAGTLRSEWARDERG